MSMPKAQSEQLMIPSRKVCDRYGVSTRTISRWLTQSAINFPKPVYLNGRRYWFEVDLHQWEDARASLHRGHPNASTALGVLDQA